MRNQAPLISFTFDDFPASAFSNGGRILEEHGVAGTYYTSLGLMGQIAPAGKIFEREDLALVLERGHELGCHTFDHCHAYDTPAREFEASIVRNRSTLEALLPGACFNTLSYPIGCPRPGSKIRSARYFAGCRAGGQRANRGTIDLNQLSAYFIEQSRDHPKAIGDMIKANHDAGAWLIFATHDVCEEPTRYGCTLEMFEEIVRQSVASGARVIPVSAALAEIGANGFVDAGCERKNPSTLVP